MRPEGIRRILRSHIEDLPRHIDQEDIEGGLLKPWVKKLPLRFQGVLLTSVRGCDAAEKEDAAKHLNRMIRRSFLNPADPRETDNSAGFFGFDPPKLEESLHEFFHSLDHYPLHYIGHMMHACEILGYCHPEQPVKDFFNFIYWLFCFTLHVNPEQYEQMHRRLTLDRIEAGTTARNF